MKTSHNTAPIGTALAGDGRDQEADSRNLESLKTGAPSGSAPAGGVQGVADFGAAGAAHSYEAPSLTALGSLYDITLAFTGNSFDDITMQPTNGVQN